MRLVVIVPSWVHLSSPRCVTRTAEAELLAARPCRRGDGDGPDHGQGDARREVSRGRAGIEQECRVPAAPEPERALSGSAPFRSAVSPISASLARRMTGVSWHAGCPVGLADLRVLTVSFWGFDRRAHSGTLIVHRSVAAPVVRVLARLYAARFPIRRMTPVDAYGGDDFRSIEADNTSAFNCRAATGSSHWSQHAYGKAIDLDPLENPYVSGGKTSHPGSRRYLDRGLQLPGMIHAGDVVVRAFAAEGWGWGGSWMGIRDYQHFSVNGR